MLTPYKEGINMLGGQKMHVLLQKAFIISWKFMSHISISYVEKDNSTLKCHPFHRTITVLIKICIISEFASLFVPTVRLLRLYGLWVCGSKFCFSGAPRKGIRKFMHAHAAWFAAPSCWNIRGLTFWHRSFTFNSNKSPT
jgi:hypothetical protein